MYVPEEGVINVRPSFLEERRGEYNGPLVRSPSTGQPDLCASKPLAKKGRGCATVSVKLEHQAEYEALRKFFLEPIVSTGSEAELAMGIRLRKQTKPAFIETNMPGVKALKAKIGQLESDGNHVGIYTLLCQLRHWQLAPGSAAPPALRLHVNSTDEVPETVDITTEIDIDAIDIDHMDQYIFNHLLAESNGAAATTSHEASEVKTEDAQAAKSYSTQPATQAESIDELLRRMETEADVRRQARWEMKAAAEAKEEVELQKKLEKEASADARLWPTHFMSNPKTIQALRGEFRTVSLTHENPGTWNDRWVCAETSELRGVALSINDDGMRLGDTLGVRGIQGDSSRQPIFFCDPVPGTGAKRFARKVVWEPYDDENGHFSLI